MRIYQVKNQPIYASEWSVHVNGFINGGNAFRERKTIGIKKNRSYVNFY